MKTCKRDEESTQMLRSLKTSLCEGKCKISTDPFLRFSNSSKASIDRAIEIQTPDACWARSDTKEKLAQVVW